MEEHIPQVVIDEARPFIEQFGQNIVVLGQKGVLDFYRFIFPEGLRTGFPYIFIYDHCNKSAKTITGFEAVDIIAEFVKE